ncbi:MAG: hypothetical protein H7Z14_06420 [Anaerolineae bacterium]|nr:hypothetical protein [Phycisphaerae bacterium]
MMHKSEKRDAYRRMMYAVRTKRLIEIGIGSYSDYLAGAWWKERRERYRQEHAGACGSVQCRYCETRAADLHHTSYQRLGAEDDADLLPLCREHHAEWHTFGSVQPATAAQREILRRHGYAEAFISSATFGRTFNLIGALGRGEVRSPREFG